MTEPTGRPLIDILGEIVEDNPDLESVSLLDVTLMREAQASINLDGNTQSLPPVDEPFEGYPRDEPMKDLDINAVGVAGYWKPPSETVLNTVDRNSYYLVETLDEVMARANEMDDNTFAMIFDLAPQSGMGQARRILVPWQAVSSIVDLSPEPTE